MRDGYTSGASSCANREGRVEPITALVAFDKCTTREGIDMSTNVRKSAEKSHPQDQIFLSAQLKSAFVSFILIAFAALLIVPRAMAQGPSEAWAGSYGTHVSLISEQNTCGDVRVQDNVTSVEISPRAHGVSISHAGNTYEGSVDDCGHFTTKPRALSGGASEYMISISGHFIQSGFEATVTVNVKQTISPSIWSRPF